MNWGTYFYPHLGDYDRPYCTYNIPQALYDLAFCKFLLTQKISCGQSIIRVSKRWYPLCLGNCIFLEENLDIFKYSRLRPKADH